MKIAIFFDARTGTVSGAVFDLIEKHMGPATGTKFQWDSGPTTIPRQVAHLKTFKRYMASLLAFVPSRQEFSIYSTRPYYCGRSNITVHVDNPIHEVKTVGDINHMVFGYAVNSYISPFMRDPSIKFDLIAAPDYFGINLKKVLKNRIDAVYSPGRGAMLVQLTKLDLLDEFRMVDLPEAPVPYHVVFSKDLPDVAKKFDAIFEKLGGAEFYLELLSRHVDVSRM